MKKKPQPHILPCIGCPDQTKICSSHCEKLYNFLRWTDNNKAAVCDQARETHVTPDFLDAVQQKNPDIPSWQDVASDSFPYGMLDLSYLSPNDKALFESRYIEDLGIEALALKYDLKVNGVKSRLKRIRRRIKDEYYLMLLRAAYPNKVFPIKF